MFKTTLQQRILTGLVLISLTIVSVLYLSPFLFSVLCLFVFVGLGGWEWAGLTRFFEKQQILFVALLLIIAISIGFLNYFFQLSTIWPVLGVFLWLGILVLLASYNRDSQFYKKRPWLLRTLAFGVLIFAWLSVSFLQGYQAQYVLYLILLISIADSAAYFSGKNFGRNKLAPELSPGKTREGLWGALFATALWAIFSAWFFDLEKGLWLYFILLSLVTALISVMGDLFESLLKRQAKQKDSGTLLPGHGGILDRIDSLLAAAPVFTLGLLWIIDDLPLRASL